MNLSFLAHGVEIRSEQRSIYSSIASKGLKYSPFSSPSPSDDEVALRTWMRDRGEEASSDGVLRYNESSRRHQRLEAGEGRPSTSLVPHASLATRVEFVIVLGDDFPLSLQKPRNTLFGSHCIHLNLARGSGHLPAQGWRPVLPNLSLVFRELEDERSTSALLQ